MNEIELLSRLGSEVPPLPDRARQDARTALMRAARTESADTESARTGTRLGGRTRTGASARIRAIARLDGSARAGGTGTPARVRSRRRGALRLGLGSALAAAAVGAAVVLPGMLDAPAYAVEKKPDGSTEITIREFLEPEKLQASLREAGVPAVVDYVPSGQRCATPRGGAVPPGRAPALGQATTGEGTVLNVGAGRLAPDRFLVIEATFDRADPARAGSVAAQVVTGPVRACDPVPAGPAGGPDRVRIPDQGGTPADPAGRGGSGTP
ncbi:hypothetical protein [Actinomadura sp. 21ATH]|uniref:hypothetical protein n=1 Tax=Actinomadura sp. 21ATH TaxID=1735444 RepID=UPI0035C14EFA